MPFTFNAATRELNVPELTTCVDRIYIDWTNQTRAGFQEERAELSTWDDYPVQIVDFFWRLIARRIISKFNLQETVAVRFTYWSEVGKITERTANLSMFAIKNRLAAIDSLIIEAAESATATIAEAQMD